MLTESEIILQNLIYNPEYASRVLPFIRQDYFENSHEKVIFRKIEEFSQKYKTSPTVESLLIEMVNDSKISEQDSNRIDETISNIKKEVAHQPMDWLLDTTEKFCQDRAIHNAVVDAISIIGGENKKLKKEAIPDILKQALSVSFDPSLGHDYLQDAEKRYEYYHKVESKIPFNLEYLNKITKGGFSKKTLNVLLAGCVHPNTKVIVRFKNNTLFTYRRIKISAIEDLLKNGYYVEIDSPDGFVEVSHFIKKGLWQEYILEIDKKKIRVNENHLFETKNGWEFAKDLVDKQVEYLTDYGFVVGIVRKTKSLIPIVDITVNHPNHRYYANGVSSHNTGGGKSAFMAHCAASNIKDGRNVLYFTMEMSEEEISKRVDANLLDLSIDDVLLLPRESYLNKLNRLKAKCSGKLIVKEYPMGGAHVGHFRSFINELKLKQGFTPDIIYVDYLNICQSLRFKADSVNSYGYVKANSEELRGLATEMDVVVVSATQLNRGGLGNSDPSMTDISDSIGTTFGVDFLCALIATDDMKQSNKVLFKQLKSRYDDMNKIPKFFVGFDRVKMKFYDIDDATTGISDGAEFPPSKPKDVPLMDSTSFGQQDFLERKKTKKNDFVF